MGKVINFNEKLNEKLNMEKEEKSKVDEFIDAITMEEKDISKHIDEIIVENKGTTTEFSFVFKENQSLDDCEEIKQWITDILGILHKD